MNEFEARLAAMEQQLERLETVEQQLDQLCQQVNRLSEYVKVKAKGVASRASARGETDTTRVGDWEEQYWKTKAAECN